jgi:cell division protein FtsN
MRNKDTGEFELIVGNGQLVSGFFIVILLFAVGVAMGYILGQNSEKSAKSQQGEAVPCVATDGRPQPSEPAQPERATVREAAAPQPAPATETPQPGEQEAPPQPTTQPAKEPEPAPAPGTKPAGREPAKPAPPAKSGAASASDAPSGSFWQVTAKANQDSARATLKILKERGFSAYLAPGPNNLTRVLVGPFKDTPSKAKAKTDLEAMGFKPIKLDRE